MFYRFKFLPTITRHTETVLDLRVIINFWKILPEAIAEALKTDPEEALTVTILKESDGYWQNVTDNSNLVNLVDLKSGSTYIMKEGGQYDGFWYNMNIRSLWAGSTYLIVADIAKHLLGNHMYIAKIRLVCFPNTSNLSHHMHL